nr:YitT family protein [Bacillus pinisoli]
MVREERLNERLLLFFSGILISAVGTVFSLKVAYLGLNAWDTLYLGLNNRLGYSIGFWSIVASLLIVVLNILVTKKRPQIGTYMEMVLLGFLIDIVYFSNIIPDVDSPVSVSLYVLVSILLIGIGTGVYMAADLGAGPVDWLILMLKDKTGYSLRKVTTLTEFSALVIGYFLGSPILAVTLLNSFLLGPIIQLAYDKTIELRELNIHLDVSKDLVCKFTIFSFNVQITRAKHVRTEHNFSTQGD